MFFVRQAEAHCSRPFQNQCIDDGRYAVLGQSTNNVLYMSDFSLSRMSVMTGLEADMMSISLGSSPASLKPSTVLAKRGTINTGVHSSIASRLVVTRGTHRATRNFFFCFTWDDAMIGAVSFGISGISASPRCASPDSCLSSGTAKCPSP